MFGIADKPKAYLLRNYVGPLQKGQVAMKKQGKTKWIMAKAGEYDWAFEVLPAVKDQNNPDVLNMLGYSYCREKNTKTYAG